MRCGGCQRRVWFWQARRWMPRHRQKAGRKLRPSPVYHVRCLDFDKKIHEIFERNQREGQGK
jgi:hypothetical protein